MYTTAWQFLWDLIDEVVITSSRNERERVRERERENERAEERGGRRRRKGREEKWTRRSFILSGSDGDIDRCNATSQTVPPPLQHLAIFFTSPFHGLFVSTQRTTRQTISTSVITEHLRNPLLYISFSLKGSQPPPPPPIP